MYERFTDRARRVMQLAVREVEKFNHEYIGTEHILLGLIGEDRGVGTTVLKNLGVSLDDIRLNVKKLVHGGADMVMVGKLLQTPAAKRVIDFAMDEARSLKHVCVGTEHILLGLLREDNGVAAQILMNFGLRLDNLRAEIESVLGKPHDWGRQQFANLSPLRSTVSPIKPPVDLPKSCPKCGNPDLVRVLWHHVSVSEQDMNDFKAGKAILGSISEMDGPAWVCLLCTPRWSEVHDLAIQDWELQVAKEKAINAMEFEDAARHRDAQDDLRRRLWQLIGELVAEV